MKYDFNQMIDRRGTDSLKWNVKDNELPMWVADMDFSVAPEILEVMRERMEHGIFGYVNIPDSWYKAYIGWWGGRHGVTMQQDELIYCAGVMPAIGSAIRELTTENENIVIQTPVYNAFFNCVKDNCRCVLENPLHYKDGAYTMDFEDLEGKLSDPRTSMMILCNPQNPVGKIWGADELARIGSLANKYHVVVISDEIHCDLTIPGKNYVPFASVSNECRDVSITCIAPTKAFNLAGLKTAALYTSNATFRKRIKKALHTDGLSEPNSFATVVATAAFERGREWLDGLREYLLFNRRLVEDFLTNELRDIKAVKGEATYLVWIDVSSITDSGRKLAAYIKKETGLFLIGGDVYGTGGEHFLRLNIACPSDVCRDGLDRLKKGIEAFKDRGSNSFEEVSEDYK